jgi:hypothetical protein
MPKLLAAMALLASLLPAALASSGDERVDFRRCAAACQGGNAAAAATTPPHPRSPLCGPGGDARAPLALRAMRWDCAADCDYLCMWAAERSKSEAAAAAGGAPAPVEKYHGKWPFTRLWGVQEPASVAFSLLNLAASLHCLARARRRLAARPRAAAAAPPPPPPLMARLWLLQLAVAANAWLWSSVFHCRDTRLTERLDYYSAGAAVAFNLFVTLVRVGGGGGEAGDRRRARAAGAPLAALYAAHVWRMQAVLFDYGRHVALCVGAGALQTAAWAAWAGGAPAGRRHPGRPPLLSFMGAVNAAMLLEVLDFPPLFGAALDAHALWHAATAPLAYLWYAFVAADLGELLEGGKKAV